MLRVIGGIHRGRRLRTIAGQSVRPTSDRLRETLFNILAPVVEGERFLDLCAGSGAVGIEALSRGAAHATFVDISRRACSVIEASLEAFGIESAADVLNRDAMAALRWLETQERKFGIVFLDPPYSSDMHSEVMKLIAGAGIQESPGLVVVEHWAKTPLEAEYGALRIFREVKQGESSLAFYAVV